ncbi:hypothetical protein O3M35_001277 [Rhynocoris fuscipes]|uniref:Uncharacterized protein n=1 Tax=Rhynocoris fuscipes TaxID=488301 RepID=A0AAW1DU75_9HEMI
MQLFAFGTTWQCADYIKISSESDQQYCQQNNILMRLYQNLKLIGPTVLPTGQLKVANFVSTISQEQL